MPRTSRAPAPIRAGRTRPSTQGRGRWWIIAPSKLRLPKVRFALPGMAITLNGIAQGYITDRIATLLQDAGMGDVLLDIGEVRALGRHP